MPAISDLFDERTAQTVDEQFVELICSDEELLLAEFDAIIAAEWPTPPSRLPRRGPGDHPTTPPGDCGSLEAGSGRRTSQPRHPGVGAWGRPRSPPS